MKFFFILLLFLFFFLNIVLSSYDLVCYFGAKVGVCTLHFAESDPFFVTSGQNVTNKSQTMFGCKGNVFLINYAVTHNAIKTFLAAS